jgi:hypothetical protein
MDKNKNKKKKNKGFLESIADALKIGAKKRLSDKKNKGIDSQLFRRRQEMNEQMRRARGK